MSNPAAIRKGQLLDLHIDRLNYGGQGVARHNGFVVFVPRTVPGEEVRARVVRRKRQFAVAEVEEILEAAPQRIEPRCQYYDRCGGCQLEHLAYADQLASKEAEVVEALQKIGGLDHVRVHPIIGAEETFGYRNKMVLHLIRRGGKVSLSLVGRMRVISGETSKTEREQIAIDTCQILDPQANALLAGLNDALTRMLGDGRDTQPRDSFGHLMLRIGVGAGHVMVKLGVAMPELAAPEHRHRWQPLIDALPPDASIWLNVMRRPWDEHFGRDDHHITGPQTLRERVEGLDYELLPDTFFQTNTKQAAVLMDLVTRWLQPRPEDTILDLYSGCGGLSLPLAQHCAEVLGIESAYSAILDGQMNARRNGLPHCTFRNGLAEKILRKLWTEGFKPSLIVLDPPRSGCHPKLLNLLPHFPARELLYVSCSPPTLARDLKALVELGYEVVEAQPLDLFPQTYHVECMVRIRPGPALRETASQTP